MPVDPRAESDEGRPSWLRRFFIGVVGVFLLVLVLSMSFSDFFIGIIQSVRVDDNVLVFPNATVVFESGMLEHLQAEFVANQHREIKACLFGRIEDEKYVVNRVLFPTLLGANVVHVVSMPCPETALIDVHSHPINQCLASDQDVSVFKELRARNPVVRMMVMCGRDRFSIV